MKHFILTMLMLHSAYGLFAQQYDAFEASHLKAGSSVESILFSGHSYRTSLHRKLETFEDLDRIIITADFDTAKIALLLDAVNRSGTIHEICISAGRSSKLPSKLASCSTIRALKIFGSPALDPEATGRMIAGMQHLETLSWICNGTAVPAAALQHLTALEWIDSAYHISADDYIQILAHRNIRHLHTGVQDLSVLPALSGSSLLSLRLTELPGFCAMPETDYLQMQDEYASSYRLSAAGRPDPIEIRYSVAGRDANEDEEARLSSMLPDGILSEERRQQPVLIESRQEPANTQPLRRTQTSTASSKFHTNPQVKPPFKGLEPKAALFTFESSQPKTIDMSSGTQVRVPANAFITADGKPVSGPVTLSYREFKTPLDILLSGIPMTYDSGGVINQFESAGMFEIYASQNNQELSLKAGAQIDINFASASAENTFNFYSYNETDSNWKYESVAPAPTAPRTLLSEFGDTLISMRRVDTTSFSDRYLDASYYYLSKYRDNARDTVLYMNSFTELKTFRKYHYRHANRLAINFKRCLPKMAVDIKDRRDSSGCILLSLDTKNNERYFPELKQFGSYRFCIEGFEKTKDFKKTFIRDHVYNDIRILYTKGESGGIIELKEQNGYVSIPFSIVNPYNHQKPSTVIRSFSRLYIRYSKKLAFRETAFNKRIALEYQNSRRRVFYSKQQKIYRALAISGMGIFNCDQVYRLRNPEKRTVYLSDSAESSLSGSATILMLDNYVNGVLTFFGSTISIQPRDIKAVIAMVPDVHGNNRYYFAGSKDIPENQKSITLQFIPDEKEVLRLLGL